jgi:hypothetical protein
MANHPPAAQRLRMNAKIPVRPDDLGNG